MHNLELAFHEAGRVVMAMLWGVWSLDKVSIADAENGDKSVEYAPIPEAEEPEPCQQFGTRLFDANLERMLAGPVARALLLGWDVAFRGSAGDPRFDHMVSVVQGSMPGGSTAEALAVIHEHEPIVQADLKRMWPIVEALAVELVCQQELSDYQIRSIIRTAVNKLPESERGWAISRLRNTPSRQEAQPSL